jgi:hypothetical protein
MLYRGSAAIMGDEKVDGSDQEYDSEDTDNGAMALADIEYTDSFEKDFYSKHDHHFLQKSVKRTRSPYPSGDQEID